MTDYLRGYVILFVNERWVFADTGEDTVETRQNRPCGHCGEGNTPEGFDACIGELPGLMNACCGHGQLRDAYAQFKDGFCLRGKEAVAFFNGGAR